MTRVGNGPRRGADLRINRPERAVRRGSGPHGRTGEWGCLRCRAIIPHGSLLWRSVLTRGRLPDEAWAVCEPLGGRPARDHRRVLDAIFWITRTGAPWRGLPTKGSHWISASRQFRRWTSFRCSCRRRRSQPAPDDQQRDRPGTPLRRRRSPPPRRPGGPDLRTYSMKFTAWSVTRPSSRMIISSIGSASTFSATSVMSFSCQLRS